MQFDVLGGPFGIQVKCKALVPGDACLEPLVETAQVPKAWADKGFVSMKPLGSWLKDLTARLAFLRSWINNGPPKCYWMSGLFSPQARFPS